MPLGDQYLGRCINHIPPSHILTKLLEITRTPCLASFHLDSPGSSFLDRLLKYFGNARVASPLLHKIADNELGV